MEVEQQNPRTGHGKDFVNREEPLVVITDHSDAFQLGGRFTDLIPIGFGANGLVFSAKDIKCDKKVAIKKISFHDSISCRYALREIRSLMRLTHDNIVSVHEILSPTGTGIGSNSAEDISKLSSIFIVQELLDTDLHHILQNQKLNAEHVQILVYQLLRGLKYIHSANVIHRDLKPANLLLNCQDLTLKIGDFGLARVLDPKYNHGGFLSDNMGTCWYRAPELLVTPHDYSRLLDVWSAGCIFGEMLLGKPLFPGINDLDVMCLVLDTVSLGSADWDQVMLVMPNKLLKNHPLCARKPLRNKIKGCDHKAVDLIEKMLTFDPAARISAGDALSHSYFQHLHCIADEPIACRPLYIESEVDDLSPTTLKKMIVWEAGQTYDTCAQTSDKTYRTQLAVDQADGSVQAVSYPNVNLSMTDSKTQEKYTTNSKNTDKENNHRNIAHILPPNHNHFDLITFSQRHPENTTCRESACDFDGDEKYFGKFIDTVYQEDNWNIIEGNEKYQKEVACGIPSDYEVYGRVKEKSDFKVTVEELKECVKEKETESMHLPGKIETTSHPFRKKDAEKCEDDEKDQVEISTRKLEEDQEIESSQSHNENSVNKTDGSNFVHENKNDTDDEHWSTLEYQLEKEMDIWQWMADVDKERGNYLSEKCNCISIDIETAENQKEFSEPSPKELENLLKEKTKNLKNERHLQPNHHPMNCHCNLCVEQCEEDNKQLYILDSLGSRTSSKESLIFGARARSPSLIEKFDVGSNNSELDYWNAQLEKDRINQQQKLKLHDSFNQDAEFSEHEQQFSIANSGFHHHQFLELHEDVEDGSVCETASRNPCMRDRLNSLEQIRLKRLIDRKNQFAPFQPLCKMKQHQEINWQLKLEDSSPEEGEFIWDLDGCNISSCVTEESEVNSFASYRIERIRQSPLSRSNHHHGASNVTESACADVFDNCSQSVHVETDSFDVNLGGAKPKKKYKKHKQKAL